MWDTIRVTIRGTWAQVTLNRPEVHNALNPQMIDELQRAFQGMGAAPGVRAIVLQGTGPSFCAGGDLNWLRSSASVSREESTEEALRLGRMLLTLYRCPKPVIARIHGSVYGGGVGLAAACDMSVALETVGFCFSEVKLGLVPAVISPFVFRKAPHGQVRRYFLTGERIPAPAARELGLVSETVGSLPELDETVQRWIRQILTNGPEAMAGAKALTDPLSDAEWEAVLKEMAGRLADRRASSEGQEGIRAFLDKRRPSWHPGDLDGAA